MGKLEQALRVLEAGPPLSIFGTRNHGALLMIAVRQRKAVQYEIGNPLTATQITRLRLSGALYAPPRVLLREDDDGAVAFKYDRPLSFFCQFGDAKVDEVAAQLDADLHEVLKAAAA